MSTEVDPVRRLWHLLEPIAATVYFAPEVNQRTTEIGYDPSARWPGYFALRAAPLGPAGPNLVSAVFYSFSPAMVRQYVPSVWRTAAPEAVLDARRTGLDLALRALWGEAVGSPELTEAAALARRAAEAAPIAARPLAAANADLAWPDEPHLALWHAANLIRESRGDGHVAALLHHGLDPVESLVSFAAVGAAPREVFASRGWTDKEWAAARDRLTGRGLLAADGTATDAGRQLRDSVEARTDELAAAPLRALGPAAGRLAQLAVPLMKRVVASGMLPSKSTLGIGRG